jgi:cytochrome c oxidase subunit IV
MHSDTAAVQKSVRSYITVFVMLMIFTIVTVAVSRFHFAVPIAIGIALVIAATKGSMVGAVFMHLSHEKQAIYGTILLTFLFFFMLLFMPVLSYLDRVRF